MRSLRSEAWGTLAEATADLLGEESDLTRRGRCRPTRLVVPIRNASNLQSLEEMLQKLLIVKMLASHSTQFATLRSGCTNKSAGSGSKVAYF